jgi:hypothetical protein
MADNEIDIVITASGNAEKVIAGIANVLSGVTDSVKSLTKNYIAYGDQVKKLALFTGMQTDETSRMIQVADDAFVEFSSLQMAMKEMSNNGIAPNIENLALLSDKFLAIQDPLARSQFLTENFSRAGIEMGKIMELGGIKVREMSAAISDSLIIDEEKAAKILASKQAVDDFNDSVEGIKYEAADRLLGIFQNMPTWAQKTTLVLGALNDVGAFQNIASLAITLSSIKNLLPITIPALATFTKGVWAFVSAQTAAIAPWVALAAAIGIAIYTAYTFLRACDSMGQRFTMLIQKGESLGNILRSLTPYGIFGKMVETAVSDYWKLTGGVHKAAGGPVSSGTSYIVGERGPELFTPSNNGFITPNNKLGGGSTIILNYQPMVSLADRFELETKLTPIIRNAMRGLA